MNIYVGNLSYNTTETGLKEAFEKYGQVDSVKIIVDRYTGRSKGFAFVEMPSDEEAKAAIAEMDGKELDGRTIKVDEARPRPERTERRSSW